MKKNNFTKKDEFEQNFNGIIKVLRSEAKEIKPLEEDLLQILSKLDINSSNSNFRKQKSPYFAFLNEKWLTVFSVGLTMFLVVVGYSFNFNHTVNIENSQSSISPLLEEIGTNILAEGEESPIILNDYQNIIDEDQENIKTLTDVYAEYE